MARLNTATRNSRVATTFEGGRGTLPSNLEQLKRAVLSCLLWEDTFYEDGESIGDRITSLARKCKPEDVNALMVKARHDYKLRHAPLWLAQNSSDADAIAATIGRADELMEFVKMHWKNGKRPLSNPMKRGLAKAMLSFDEYQLSKWGRAKGEVTLRDVQRLVHPKPHTDEQQRVQAMIKAGTLKPPKTHESRAAAGMSAKKNFGELLAEGRLGYMALLKNLRNMDEAGVDKKLITKRLIEGAPKSKALPFRFIAAARHVPSYASVLNDAMLSVPIKTQPGRTFILVDVSGSMVYSKISERSELDRLDAAIGLTIYARQAYDDVHIFAFSNDLWEIENYRGLPLINTIRSLPNGGTSMGMAIKALNQEKTGYDRLIVITDEQSNDRVPLPLKGSNAYIVNVAPYQVGVGYGAYTHVNGWSEHVIRYIAEMERLKVA